MPIQKRSGGPTGFPGSKGPNIATKFVVREGPFVDGVPEAPFIPSLGEIERVSTPSVQGGYSTVANLLVTTLAAVAAVSAVPRAATEQGAKAAQSISAAQPLGQFVGLMPGAAVEAPVGHQQLDSATRAQGIGSAQQQYNPLPLGIGLPIGARSLDSAPQRVAGGATWDRGSNILFLPVAAVEIPVGRQETDSAPSQVTQRSADQALNLVILLPAQAPVGHQQVESAPAGPGGGSTNQQPNLLTTLGIGQPVGHQATDSAPQRSAGVAAWGQGTSALFLPAQPPAPLPIGRQVTDSAPQVVAGGKTWDQGSQALYLPVAPVTANVRAATFNPLKPAPGIGSAMPQSVPLGLMPVGVASTPIPIGAQSTANQVTTARVQAQQAPNLLTTTLAAQPIPVGKQKTDSAPIQVTQRSADQVPNLAIKLPVVIPDPLPIGLNAPTFRVDLPRLVSETSQSAQPWLLDTSVTPPAPGPGFPGFDVRQRRVLHTVHHRPSVKLWWQRKPASMTDEAAEEALAPVAAAVSKTARDQVKRGSPPNKAEAKKAVKDLLPSLPGFDWNAYYQQAYAAAKEAQVQANTVVSPAELAALMQAHELAMWLAAEDDDDCALLALMY